jgi:hypothetical protein
MIAPVASKPYDEGHPEPDRRIFQSQSFTQVRDVAPRQRYEDLEFRACTFEDCSVGQTGPDPHQRSFIRNVQFIRCTFKPNAIGPVVLEDVVIERPLLRHGRAMPFVLGVALNRVTIRGFVNALWFLIPDDVSLMDHDRGAAMRRWNADFYSTVDWALDISDAEFATFDFRPGIPARLIRRDPATQVIIRRDAALEHDWASLRLPDSAWNVGMERFLESGHPDHVFVAEKRNRRFAAQSESIAMLRALGVALPD